MGAFRALEVASCLGLPFASGSTVQSPLTKKMPERKKGHGCNPRPVKEEVPPVRKWLPFSRSPQFLGARFKTEALKQG
jgi:hypothetical protein